MATMLQAKRMLRQFKDETAGCMGGCINDNLAALAEAAVTGGDEIDPQLLMIQARDKCMKTCATNTGTSILNRELQREGEEPVDSLEQRPGLHKRLADGVLGAFGLKRKKQVTPAQIAGDAQSAVMAKMRAEEDLRRAQVANAEASLAMAAARLSAMASGATPIALTDEERRMIDQIVRGATAPGAGTGAQAGRRGVAAGLRAAMGRMGAQQREEMLASLTAQGINLQELEREENVHAPIEVFPQLGPMGLQQQLEMAVRGTGQGGMTEIRDLWNPEFESAREAQIHAATAPAAVAAATPAGLAAHATAVSVAENEADQFIHNRYATFPGVVIPVPDALRNQLIRMAMDNATGLPMLHQVPPVPVSVILAQAATYPTTHP